MEIEIQMLVSNVDYLKNKKDELQDQFDMA